MLPVLLKGFATIAGLIVAIGAQNTFVISQGLMQRHLLTTALLCSCMDALLILGGVLGFGTIISAYALMLEITKYFAALFLIVYGALSLKAAWTCKQMGTHTIDSDQPRKKNNSDAIGTYFA
jgi:L-lysine exporter family protein LysE/ArgO